MHVLGEFWEVDGHGVGRRICQLSGPQTIPSNIIRNLQQLSWEGLCPERRKGCLSSCARRKYHKAAIRQLKNYANFRKRKTQVWKILLLQKSLNSVPLPGTWIDYCWAFEGGNYHPRALPKKARNQGNHKNHLPWMRLPQTIPWTQS